MRARDKQYELCLHCNKLCRVDTTATEKVCPRCHATLHSRTPNSIAKCVALCITAIVLLIPANIYPVTNIEYLGSISVDTIMSGVIKLYNSGMISIALLVFFASIFIPLMKLIGLLFLALVVTMKWPVNRRQATVMYRFISAIGKWSMLDLFMISILVTLLDMGSVIDMQAGIGTTAFAMVVILTIFSANFFDVRLIWDLVDKSDAKTRK